MSPDDQHGRALPVTALVAVVSGVACLLGQVATMAGPSALIDPETLRVLVAETPFGAPMVLRVVLFTMLLAVALWPATPRRRAVATLLVGTPLLVTQAWLGHAAQGGPHGAAMIAAYAVHVLAAAAWVGSLPALIGALLRRRAGGEPASASPILVRYSALAAPCAALLLASGLTNAAFHAGRDLAALADSDYGRLLAAKLFMLIAMLLCAAPLRFVLVPRLRRGDRLDGILALAAAEWAIGLVVFLAAAVLGITPPPV